MAVWQFDQRNVGFYTALFEHTQLCSSIHSSVRAYTALFEHTQLCSSTHSSFSSTHSSFSSIHSSFSSTHSSFSSIHSSVRAHQHTHTVLFKHISTHSSDRAHQHRIPLLLGTVFGVAASGIVVSYAVAPGIGPAKRFKCRFTSSSITVARQRGVHEAFMSTQLGS